MLFSLWLACASPLAQVATVPPALSHEELIAHILHGAAMDVEIDDWSLIGPRAPDLDDAVHALPGRPADLEGQPLVLEPSPDRELCWASEKGHVCAGHYPEGIVVHQRL
jgi:hypothetical protein